MVKKTEEVKIVLIYSAAFLAQAPLFYLNKRKAKAKASRNQKIYKEMYRGKYGF